MSSLFAKKEVWNMIKADKKRTNYLNVRGEVRPWLGMEDVTAIRFQGEHIMKLRNEILVDIPVQELKGRALIINLAWIRT
jgi:hypothetical protein